VVTGSWILVLDVKIDLAQVQPAVAKALGELAGVEVLDVTVILSILESLHVARRLVDASSDNMTVDYFISVASSSGESVAGQLADTTPVTAAAAVAAQLTENFSVQVLVKELPTITGRNPKWTTGQTSTTLADTESSKTKESGRNQVFLQSVAITALACMGCG